MILRQEGPEMIFASLQRERAEAMGLEGATRLAQAWKTMLETAGANVDAYPIETGRILFVSPNAGVTLRVKEFVLQQPETDWFEFKENKYFPEGRTGPLTDTKERWRRDRK